MAQGLITVLKDELKVEKERYRTPEAVMDGPPSGFELQDRPNCTVLLLARSFGDEDIFVEVRAPYSGTERGPDSSNTVRGRHDASLTHSRCVKPLPPYSPFSQLSRGLKPCSRGVPLWFGGRDDGLCSYPHGCTGCSGIQLH